ncbi:MAG: OmpA family protein [Saccharospirillaceae bacterium]|nr:OmpA family protein [Saccharospirillaceae bacterium]MCD8532753.1 OmpA family protein [Saccharospirillaceae bacterium]
MNVKYGVLTTAFLCSAAMAEPAPYYGTFGVGYVNNEPFNSLEADNGRHVYDSFVGELAGGYRFNKDAAVEIAWLFESPSQKDSRPDIDQFRLNGLYYFTQNTLKPYITAGLGYERFDSAFPRKFEGEGVLLALGSGVEYNFSRNFFARAEINVNDIVSESFEHLMFMGKIGYAFGSRSSYKPQQAAVVTTVSDSDNDGVSDSQDLCPGTVTNTAVNELGCAVTAASPEPAVEEKAEEVIDCNKVSAEMARSVPECAVFQGRLNNIVFKSGSSELTAPSEATLADIAAQLQRYPATQVSIAAYTDSSGNEALNLQLSKDRAEAVRRFLMGHGIASDRLSAEGYGEANPVADNSTREGRAKNRRVEFSVVRK